jgi:hypothetical protein
MGKTAVAALLELRPEIEEKFRKATLRAGWYDGFEYRISSDDPKFSPNENKCNECKEIHRSPYEGKWIRPDRPLEIGMNWAKKHHVQSIIESRSSLYEIIVGVKTVYQGTLLVLDSFRPQGDWEIFQTISESGKITPVGETHRPIKLKID